MKRLKKRCSDLKNEINPGLDSESCNKEILINSQHHSDGIEMSDHLFSFHRAGYPELQRIQIPRPWQL